MFTGFEKQDFELFEIQGLENRMEALKTQLRPKFELLGEQLSPELMEITGANAFAHVAKHARRKTNPPDDSWVAFASNQRGYKMMPHFQITVWSSHVLIQWGIIYEARNKQIFAEKMKDNLEEIKRRIPGEYQWSKDHMKPEGKRQQEMSEQDFEEFIQRLLFHKKGEVMVGLVLPKEQVLAMEPEEFLNQVKEAWTNLNYLHQLAQ